MTRRRLLVFGGGGWLGTALVAAATARGDEVLAPRSSRVDVADPTDVEGAFAAARPQVVVNLAAVQPGASSERLEAVNVMGARWVAEAAARRGVRLVHVSTDMVLDGCTPPYADEAPRRALTPYGRSKARGEEAVLACCPDALCVRTSLLWDPDTIDRTTAGFAKQLEAGLPCRLFTDEIRCPVARGVLADALLDLADRSVRGTLNVAGGQALSRYDYASALLAHFAIEHRERIEGVRAEDLERAGASPRPRDLTLDIARAESLLGRALPGFAETLRALRTPPRAP